MMMSQNYTCTCQAPARVELQTGQEGSYDVNQERLLLQNLKHFGWSPISVTGAPSPCPSHEEIVRLFPPSSGRCCNRNGRDDDVTNVITTKDDTDVIYHSAESGSSEGSVEPKESYEVHLSKCLCGDGDDDDGSSNNVIKTWCRTLSWIAHQVCTVLQVPPNTLLVDDDVHNNNNNNAIQESLDLLRVFHYYATPTTQELGSSPHTDWGSLTVVWQDDVGGLQTYCRACHKWVDVKPSSTSTTSSLGNSIGQETERRQTDTHRWECIIHVGDMASLVLDVGNDIDAVVDSGVANKAADNTKNLTRSICWPSPKHRVVSSASRERTSLVYFGYPPASCSLQTIQDALRDWKPSLRGHRLPLRDYYLLQDQSSNASAADGETANTASSSSSAGTTRSSSCAALSQENQSYSLIREMNIRDIVAWKWSQVQRD